MRKPKVKRVSKDIKLRAEEMPEQYKEVQPAGEEDYSRFKDTVEREQLAFLGRANHIGR